MQAGSGLKLGFDVNCKIVEGYPVYRNGQTGDRTAYRTGRGRSPFLPTTVCPFARPA
ncbi:MAG: hypothetical protein FWG68_02070 [Defluviitaleaceae bacterium]|nr:hypothetical protein [Defluviitaleaceae bacterium]